MKAALVVLRNGLLLVITLAAPASQSLATGASDFRAGVEAQSKAKEKIAEAHRLLLTQRPLDMGRFAKLLGDAHNLAPALDRQIAAEMRRCTIHLAGLVPMETTIAWVDGAVKLDHRLAFDDTLVKLTTMLPGQPPEMARRHEARQVKAPPKASKETSVAVVPLQSFGKDVLLPIPSANLGQNPMGADPKGWPRILTQLSPDDPRGPDALPAKVMVTAIINEDGRLSEIKAIDGPNELKGAAELAVRQSRFSPFKLFGHAVESTVSIPVVFTGKSDR